ncbi:ABC transporter ATP-binding protein [Dictyobacter alpinus]|uniref:ABC transporter ATP-binding protein n=1 Tax=Dictyobacter alpinus TaxID=2014873 RepID=A0A402BA65_9CHLR|nr:ATP-binding cassette domain-containing protein [Dictyobacter alpinus]GCE28283.1 ABC transporter ATP-binding protein [Dictyobacter alpinus]
MPAIHVDSVSFTYAGSVQPTLRSLNVTIPEGEFLLLAGPSGCGKSTLALALAGLIPTRIAGAFEGHIYLDKNDVSAMELHQVSQHIGIVFQNPDEQLVHLDVESEVAFGPENMALPNEEIERRVAQSLAYTQMEQLRTLEIFALSGGQKQRVAIAATLAMQSRILILDEPTSDLDPVGTQEVLGVLRSLNKEYGWTIILIEHKIDEVIPWVDRVLLMDEGRITIDAPARTAFTDPTAWQHLGVSIPQMITLAHTLPEVFQATLPLSVDEVYAALRNTSYAQVLRQQARQAIAIHPLASRQEKNILSWEKVSLRYGAKRVLDEVDLNVYQQEWVALIGANGMGKTSLASLAMGFQAPTHGQIQYEGRQVIPGRISRQSEHMAYLFQAADKMLFTATVEQELLFGLKHQRKKNKQATMPYSIDQLLEIIDLSAYRDFNPFHLSHGQRKRLALGALLTRYPRVFILDEPTTGQDEGHAHAFLQFLEQLREREQLTYLMITHNMESVAQYASRVVVLNDGQIVMDDAPSFVFAHGEELARYGILPPPVSRLHARLCEGDAQQVALNIDVLVKAFQAVKALL